MEQLMLKIGNYVFDSLGNVCQITSINKSYCYLDDNKEEIEYKDIHPIPLTEELIIEFGAKKVIEKTLHFNIEIVHFKIENFNIFFIKDGFEIELKLDNEQFNLMKTFKYVHQLQNLFSILNEKELIKK